jgi:hypothetical protein
MSFVSWTWTVHFSFAPKKSRGQWSVFYGLKVYQVPKCIEGYQCSMGTVSCHNRWSTNGSRSSRMVAQALSMRKEPDSRRLAPSSCLMLVQPFLTSRSIRRPSVVTWHCSHTALISFYAFWHLVHLQPIKNGSLPSALLWCKWNADRPSLWHKTHDINELSKSHLHHNSSRQVDHTYHIMPNQQCNQLRNMYLHCG